MAERDQHLDVHLDLRVFVLQIVREEAAGQAKPCIVHQQVDLNAAAFEFLTNVKGGVGMGEVDAKRDGLHAVPGGQVLRQRLQGIPRPGHQHEIHSTRGKCLREGFS